MLFILFNSLICTCIQGEGVAFRGRVLLQLETLLGEMPEIESDDILNDDIYKVQVNSMTIAVYILKYNNVLLGNEFERYTAKYESNWDVMFDLQESG